MYPRTECVHSIRKPGVFRRVRSSVWQLAVCFCAHQRPYASWHPGQPETADKIHGTPIWAVAIAAVGCRWAIGGPGGPENVANNKVTKLKNPSLGCKCLAHC